MNLSAAQLDDPCFVGDVGDVAAVPEETGIDPAALVLEITESMMTKDAEGVVEKLLALKALGLRISDDDFGTGYSSLAYLKRFSVDYLKIDRSFVDGLGSEP